MTIQYVKGLVANPIKTPAFIMIIADDEGNWDTSQQLAISKKWPIVEESYKKWHAGQNMRGGQYFDGPNGVFSVGGKSYKGPIFGMGAVQQICMGDYPWGDVVAIRTLIALHGPSWKGKKQLSYDGIAYCLCSALGDFSRVAWDYGYQSKTFKKIIDIPADDYEMYGKENISIHIPYVKGLEKQFDNSLQRGSYNHDHMQLYFYEGDK